MQTEKETGRRMNRQKNGMTGKRTDGPTNRQKKGETGGRMDRIKNNTVIERRKNRQRKVWVNDNRKKRLKGRDTERMTK